MSEAFNAAMILNKVIPYDPLRPKAMPGISPLDQGDWLRVDETYAAQLAEKARIVEKDRDLVLAMSEDARLAAEELLETVVTALIAKEGFSLQGNALLCPDERLVELDRSDPMLTLSQLTQEDFCILQKQGLEHVLTGASLCFPASWLLAEKFMRPLINIHEPVASYDENIARRVQPLWRFNALWYADPALHQPRSAHERRDERFAETAKFMRSELQTIRRLPLTGAVIFGIHTYVLAECTLNRQSACP
jgi:hypothetical protein